METYDGKRVHALTFMSNPLATLPCELAPTESYMRLLREGAADNWVDPTYQVRAARWGALGDAEGLVFR